MRWAIAVVALAACAERKRPPERRAAPDAYPQPTVVVTPPPDARPPLPDAREPMTSAPTRCLAPGVEGATTVGAKTITYCQDLTCAIWDRKTKKVRIEGRFDVEAEPAAAVGTSAQPKPDDARISFPDDRIELCPPSRACFQFRPDQSNGVQVQRAGMNDAGTFAAVSLSAEGGAKGRVELWSVGTGRRVAQIALGRPDPEDTYEIHAEFVADGLITYVIDSQGYATATLYGLDGRKRAALGEGSRYLDYDNLFLLDPRRLAVFDWGEDGAPYRVLVQDVRTGAVKQRFTIPLAGDENALVDRFEEAIIVTEQWTQQLRIDVIDARPKKGVHQFFVAPGC